MDRLKRFIRTQNIILVALWIPLATVTFITECIADTVKWFFGLLKGEKR